MSNTDTRKTSDTSSAANGRVGSGALLGRLKRIVTENGKFAYGTPARCLDVVEHVFAAHRRMCDNLQTCVQKHELGLGGEPVDEIVVAALETRLSENPAPLAEIEARIKAHTQPSGEVIELALCEARRLVLKPNVLYRFTVRPGCKTCEAEALA